MRVLLSLVLATCLVGCTSGKYTSREAKAIEVKATLETKHPDRDYSMILDPGSTEQNTKVAQGWTTEMTVRAYEEGWAGNQYYIYSRRKNYQP